MSSRRARDHTSAASSKPVGSQHPEFYDFVDRAALCFAGVIPIAFVADNIGRGCSIVAFRSRERSVLSPSESRHSNAH